MNKKQYRMTLIIFGIISIALVVTRVFYEYVDWFVIFIVLSIFYMFVRYKISSPIQAFAKKFNMLVDYDLDVEEALRLAEDYFENSPTETLRSLVQIYVGMALYYNARYRDAINTFNQINLPKVNNLYHVLIFAFTGYAAYEEGDLETLDLCINRIEDIKNRVNKKYIAFALSYQEILKVIRNLDIDPEKYREVIEKNFSREDGYISTKLIYNYRIALYYKTVNDVEEMDKCLAKVIANGKNHHTVISAKKIFQNTCSVEDYVFPAQGTETEIEEVEIVEEPKQLD